MTRAWNYTTGGKKERRKLHDYKLHNLQTFPSNIQPSCRVYRSIQKCTEVYRSIQKCTEVYRSIQKHIEVFEMGWTKEESKMLPSKDDLRLTLNITLQRYIENGGICPRTFVKDRVYVIFTVR